jgi:hypothetical protein
MRMMKKSIKNLYWILSLALIFGVTSCKKSNDAGNGVPVITRVRTVSKTITVDSVNHRITLDSSSVYSQTEVVKFDSTTTNGNLNNQYAIIGQNLGTVTKVSFNGVSAYFNPALVTNTSIIITIPANAPWGPTQPNKLTVVTLHGTASFDFVIQQPPPVITSFGPLAGAAGDTVTITGTVFDNVSSVKFGTVPATIISSTSTQIKVKIPQGVVQAYLFVTTPGGTTQSAAAFGFKYVVYDDALAKDWQNWSWSSTVDFAYTTIVKRGTDAISETYTGGYAGLQLGFTGAAIDVASNGLTAIKFSIYGGTGTNGKHVKVIVSGGWGTTIDVTLTEGAWSDYTIPLSQLGSPTTISSVVLQEDSGNAPSTIYVDDIGFI